MGKITDYAALGSALPDDLLAVVDVHDDSMSGEGTTKKVTAAGLLGLTPSGDSSGAADLASINGLLTLAGRAVLGAGQFYINGAISAVQAQNVTGPGSSLCTIICTSAVTSYALLAALSGTFTGGAYGGTFTGFTLNGYSAGGSANGIQLENLQGLDIDDVVILGFGGKGVNFLNSSGDWAEQHTVRARIEQCGTAAVFDSSSFDYSNFDFTIVTGPGQGGITLQNGAQLQGAVLRLRGNFYGTPGNTAAVIAMDPGNTAGTSYVTNAACSIAVESAGSGTGHYTLLQGSSSGASQFTGTGTFSFSQVGPAFQGYSTAGASFSFAGIINDPVIGTTTPGETGLMVYGQTITNAITVLGNGNLASGNPAIFLQGDSQTWQFFCDNGDGNFGVWDQTFSKTAFNIVPDTEQAIFSGLLSANGGTDTSGTAAASSPTFASGTARQVSTTQDVILYIAIQTSAALAVAIGPTSVPANTVMPSQSYALGLNTIPVPKGWWVKITGTVADLTVTAVTC